MATSVSDFFGNLRHRISNLRLSLIESLVLLAALLFAGAVGFMYFTKIQPRNTEIAELEERVQKAKDAVKNKSSQFDRIKTQNEKKQEIIDSLDRFESRLEDREQAMIDVVRDINLLAKKNGILVPGYNYRSSDSEPIPGINVTAAVDTSATPSSSPSPTPTPTLPRSIKDVKLYPSLGVDTQVEGTYSSLRKFIYDLERSPNFIVINSVAFQGVDEKTKQLKAQLAPGGVPQPGPAGAPVMTIALKLEMESFFRKPDGTQVLMYPASTGTPQKK
jgi:Tfp pilus assembly protein PilO